MPSVVFAVIAVFAASLDGVVWKYTIDRKGCPWAGLILFHILSVVLLLPVTSRSDLILPGAEVTALLLLSSLFWVVGDLFARKAYRYLDAAVCQLYGSLKLVLITMAGVVLFAERLSTVTVCGILLVLFSIVYQLDLRSLRFNKGAIFSLVAVIGQASALILDKHLTSLASEGCIVFYGFLLPALMYTVAGRGYLKNIPHTLKVSNYRFLLCPLLGCSSYYCLIQALSSGQLSLTYIIQETGVLMVLILEVLILRSRENLLHKALACSACTAGAIMACGFS